MKKLIYKNYAFTLIELIIVITIISILSTVAFVSFQTYIAKTNDSNRLANLKNATKALEISNITTGTYPEPNNIFGSGYINGTLISKVGYLNSDLQKLLKISGKLNDPVNSNDFLYGVSFDKKYYQIGTISQTQIGYIINSTYADGQTLNSKVDGNYNGIIKFSTGSKIYLANVPSLLFFSGGTFDLISQDPGYILNNGKNLSYKLNPTDNQYNQTLTGILNDITGTSSTLTGVDITNLNSSNLNTIFSGSLLQAFGSSLDKVSQIALGLSSNNNLLIQPTGTYFNWLSYDLTNNAFFTNDWLRNNYSYGTNFVSNSVQDSGIIRSTSSMLTSSGITIKKFSSKMTAYYEDTSKNCYGSWGRTGFIGTGAYLYLEMENHGQSGFYGCDTSIGFSKFDSSITSTKVYLNSCSGGKHLNFYVGIGKNEVIYSYTNNSLDVGNDTVDYSVDFVKKTINFNIYNSTGILIDSQSFSNIKLPNEANSNVSLNMPALKPTVVSTMTCNWTGGVGTQYTYPFYTNIDY